MNNNPNYSNNDNQASPPVDWMPMRNDYASRLNSYTRGPGADLTDQNNPKLFVGNLPCEMTSEALRHMFEGPDFISALVLPSKLGNGQFGFVTYSSMKAAENAITKNNNRMVMNNKITVRPARTKEENERRSKERQINEQFTKDVIAQRSAMAVACSGALAADNDLPEQNKPLGQFEKLKAFAQNLDKEQPNSRGRPSPGQTYGGGDSASSVPGRVPMDAGGSGSDQAEKGSGNASNRLRGKGGLLGNVDSSGGRGSSGRRQQSAARADATSDSSSGGSREYCTTCKIELENPKKCTRCKTVSYCGVECQKKDWTNHKPSCHKPGDSPRGAGDINEIIQKLTDNPHFDEMVSVDINDFLSEKPKLNSQTQSQQIPIDKLDVDSKGLRIFNLGTPSCFYVYKDIKAMIEMSKALNLAISASSKGDINFRPKVKEFCAACYNEEWYRAQVVSLEADSLSVYFVDFGNKENLKFSDLRPLAPEYFQLPQQCCKCKLAGVESLQPDGQWPPQALDLMKEVLGNGFDAQVVTMDADTYHLKIFDKSKPGNTLNQLLLAAGHAREARDSSRSSPAAPSSLARSSPGPSKPRGPSPTSTQQRPVSSDTAAAAAKDMKVVVHSIVDPGLFYVTAEQQLAQTAPIIRQLMQLASTLPSSRFSPRVGHLVCGMFQGALYRAVVKQLAPAGADQAQLFFIDYGNTEDGINFSQMCPMPNELRDIPAFAVPCSLKDIIPPNNEWAPAAVEFMKSEIDCESLYDMKMYTEPDDIRPASVALFNKSGLDMGGFLTAKKLAVYSKEYMEEFEKNSALTNSPKPASTRSKNGNHGSSSPKKRSNTQQAPSGQNRKSSQQQGSNNNQQQNHGRPLATGDQGSQQGPRPHNQQSQSSSVGGVQQGQRRQNGMAGGGGQQGQRNAMSGGQQGQRNAMGGGQQGPRNTQQGPRNNMGGGQQGPRNTMGGGQQGQQNTMGGGQQGQQNNMGGGQQGPRNNMGGGQQGPRNNMGGGQQGPRNTMGGGQQGQQNNMGGGQQGPRNTMGGGQQGSRNTMSRGQQGQGRQNGMSGSGGQQSQQNTMGGGQQGQGHQHGMAMDGGVRRGQQGPPPHPNQQQQTRPTAADADAFTRFMTASLPLMAMPSKQFIGTIAHVESPSQFFLQVVTNENLKQLHDLSEKLMSWIKNGAGPAPYRPMPGELVCAFFPQDQTWYRATMLYSSEEDQIHVHYIDFGNSSTLTTSQIRPITRELAILPRYVLKCCLNGVAPTGAAWSNDSKQFMQKMQNETIRVTPVFQKGDWHYVDVFLGNQSMGVDLMQRGLAKKRTAASTSHPQQQQAPATVAAQALAVPPPQPSPQPQPVLSPPPPPPPLAAAQPPPASSPVSPASTAASASSSSPSSSSSIQTVIENQVVTIKSEDSISILKAIISSQSTIINQKDQLVAQLQAELQQKDALIRQLQQNE